MKLTMKALSVQNPWAWWIMFNGKPVENRTWKTKFRGRILIHASLRWDNNAPSSHWLRGAPNPMIVDIENKIELCKRFNGFILGSVEIYDCVQDSDSEWAQPGLYHWLLRDPEPWDKPVSVKGSLGLWQFTGDAE
ncbi:hypothetical protein AGMMS50268_16920 [Spirochaetia bacterium]|nr:hypothetical protein AGMMS50268_16920 [Spirochaetia bacterium]